MTVDLGWGAGNCRFHPVIPTFFGQQNIILAFQIILELTSLLEKK